MANRFEEQDLIFDFGTDWHVIKYDDHADFNRRIKKFRDSRAVDFIAVYDKNSIWFIEVKDFRGYPTNNRRRINSGDLAQEVAIKVRDSVAGAVGARQMSSTPDTWKPPMKCLNIDRSIFVVLWLEEDIMSDPGYAMTLTSKIKEHLRWLTTQVIVSRIASVRKPPSLTVRYKPGAIRP